MTPCARAKSIEDLTTSGAALPEPPKEFVLEKTLAEELQKLSFKERVEIEEEVHGVRCGAVEETPELIRSSLKEFDDLLNSRKERNELPDNGDNKNNSYLLRNVVRVSLLDETEAQAAKSKCYLNDPDIRLRFLRCETFSVQDAVERFINFILFTGDLFGDFVAYRPLSLSDFTTREQRIFQNSRCQYLRFRDRSGRRILSIVGSCNFDLPSKIRYKILMYLHWVASEDIETQRKGVVTIIWVFNEDGRPDLAWDKMRPQMDSEIKNSEAKYIASRPIRLCGIHQYYPQDTLLFRLLANLYVFTIPASERKYYKYFFGDHTELLYKLNGFGVSSDMLPVSSTLKVKLTWHHTWCQFRREKERQERNNTGSNEEIIECPRLHDVVFKKGPAFRMNPGNSRFRSLIEDAASRHQAAEGNDQKFQITQSIVKQVEESGGRFLESSGQMWIVNKDRNKIRSKVAACMKQYNRQRNALQQMSKLKVAVRDAETIIESPPRSPSPNKRENKRDDEVSYSLVNKGAVAAVPSHHHMFINHERNSKRPRIEGCFGGIGSDKSCFGKSFFPLWSESNRTPQGTGTFK